MKNKNLLIVLVLVFSFTFINIKAQVGIGENQFTPVSSAIFEVRSSDKGVLLPHFDWSSLPASPADGLIVYVDSGTPPNGFGFYVYDATQTEWRKLSYLNEDIQDLDLTGNILTITNNTNATEIDLSPFSGTNTDNQTLTLTGLSLSITGGNSVDLSALQDGTGTDNQQLSLSGTTLSLEDGGSVNLSTVQDGTGTDNQQLSLSSNTLSLEDGGNVDLSNYLQSLSISGNSLTISDGNSVDLSALQDGTGTDNQQISLSGNTLSLEDGGSVDLSTYAGVSGSGAATQVAYWSGASTITGNSNLYWDNTNVRLGIGTASPQAAIDVVGTSYLKGDIYTGGNIELNHFGSGDRVAYFDFHTADGNDYEARFVRYPGENGFFDIVNRGTGEFRFLSETNGSDMSFWTMNSSGSISPRIYIETEGQVGINTNVIPAETQFKVLNSENTMHALYANKVINTDYYADVKLGNTDKAIHAETYLNTGGNSYGIYNKFDNLSSTDNGQDNIGIYSKTVGTYGYIHGIRSVAQLSNIHNNDGVYGSEGFMYKGVTVTPWSHGILGYWENGGGKIGISAYAGVLGYISDLIDNTAINTYGGYFYNDNDNAATSKFGVFTEVTATGGTNNYGIYANASGASTNYAGYFNGNTHVQGAFSATSKSFLIDHPDDPANKTLRHYSIESDEMMVMYRGKVKLSETGEAVVDLPDYFNALVNEEGATVVLTSIGRPFQCGYEISNNVLKVYGEPSRQVSYLVMADRDDPASKLVKKPVVQDKGEGNVIQKGKYFNPKAYGYNRSQAIFYNDKK